MNTNIEDPISTRETITSERAKQQNDEPEPKRPRLSNEEQLSNTKLLHSIENLIENSVKQITETIEKNNRAIRGVDKTLDQLTD